MSSKFYSSIRFLLSAFTPIIKKKKIKNDDASLQNTAIANSKVCLFTLASSAIEKEEAMGREEETEGEAGRDTARNGRVVASDNRRTERLFFAYGLSLLTAQLLIRRVLDRRRHRPVVRGALA